MMTKVYNHRLKKHEEGQSMLEFVLVMPVFFLLLAMIIDYGWLFYNYADVNDAARNGARIACVEYEHVCLTEEGVLQSPTVYTVDDINKDDVHQEVKDILKAVSNSVNNPNYIKQIKITYSADNEQRAGVEQNVDNRFYGDVTVQVKYIIPVFTPILGVTSDHMKKTLTSESTFKVEKQDH